MRVSKVIATLVAVCAMGALPVHPSNAATASAARPASAAQAGVEDLVAAAIAGNPARLREIAGKLAQQPRPPRVDRRVAREANDRGLALWRRQRYAEAAVQFRLAQGADPGHAEIAENLGYALFKAGELAAAERAILSALTLAPERASAWGTLGQLRAKTGRHREGVALMLTAYRFVRDRQRTLEVYARLAATDEDPRVRALLSEVVSRISSEPLKSS